MDKDLFNKQTTQEDLPIEISIATVKDLDDYIKIRLEAYENNPEAFGIDLSRLSEELAIKRCPNREMENRPGKSF